MDKTHAVLNYEKDSVERSAADRVGKSFGPIFEGSEQECKDYIAKHGHPHSWYIAKELEPGSTFKLDGAE